MVVSKTRKHTNVLYYTQIFLLVSQPASHAKPQIYESKTEIIICFCQKLEENGKGSEEWTASTLVFVSGRESWGNEGRMPKHEGKKGDKEENIKTLRFA